MAHKHLSRYGDVNIVGHVDNLSIETLEPFL